MIFFEGYYGHKKMLFVGMFCVSGSLFASQGPRLSGENPIQNTGVYHATKIATDFAVDCLPKGSGVIADYGNVSDRIASAVDRHSGKIMSDQAWDMMKFYDQHDMTEAMFDHGLQMRHSGCNIQ